MSAALSAEAVRDWVGGTYYDRGKTLARDEAANDGRTYGVSGGVRVCARVTGTYAPFYRVAATVADGRVTAAVCTCPVGGGTAPGAEGRCKHVAALLLSWRKRPEAFVPGENPRVALARRTKAELAEMVLALLNRVAETDEEAWERDPEEDDADAADWQIAPDPAPPAV
ncbi:SWIM zinc finger domain-containing protein [Alienimonas sp. DA493]|uniref:SWIM zinc finger family protein n=1 Tax=Alienimonas sp. DA493 TaxID=3373605 RepID=UPI0037540511